MVLRLKEYSDSDYDICGNTTIAVIDYKGMTIPLCGDCLDSLIKSVEEFQKHTLCAECIYWHRSINGGIRGTCELKCKKDGKNFNSISKNDYGHIYYTDCMGTCDKAINKNNPPVINSAEDLESVDNDITDKQEEDNNSFLANLLFLLKKNLSSSESDINATIKEPKIDVYMDNTTKSITVNISTTQRDINISEYAVYINQYYKYDPI